MVAKELDTIFQRLFRPLKRQVARMVGCDHVAEELVQDVFLSLWRHRDAIDVRGDVTSYLRRSVRNRALDYLRRERR